MNLLWFSGTSILDHTIHLCTGQDCQHFAFCFESRASGLLFESNLLGTHPSFLNTTLLKHKIVHHKRIEIPIDVEDAIWDLVVQKYDGKGYDFGGAAFLGGTRLLNRTLRVTIPKKNSWSNSGLYFCDEVYDVFNSFPKYFPQIPVCNGMDTPHDMWLKVDNAS